MAILIDQPRWPAHGTRFAHLVSDRSLAELHAFAGRTGIALRAFDHDHYDVAEERWQSLVAAGATPVASGELVRRLRAAGLRVRPAERTPSRAAVLPALRAAFDALLPGAGALREDLLGRWSEPQRHYHDVRHLAQALGALDDLAEGHEPPAAARLALWFHDAVYRREAGRDEAASAELAAGLLSAAGLPACQVREVARLVLLTRDHAPDPADTTGCLVSDADLSVLGLPPARYQVYVRDVRCEYRDLDEASFRAGRLRVLADLAGRAPLFATPVGQLAWGEVAARNLAAERQWWDSREVGARA